MGCSNPVDQNEFFLVPLHERNIMRTLTFSKQQHHSHPHILQNLPNHRPAKKVEEESKKKKKKKNKIQYRRLKEEEEEEEEEERTNVNDLIKFARRPLGGSFVIFTPFCKIGTGKNVAGIDVSHKRKSG